MTVKKKGEELGEDGRWKKGGEGYKEGSFVIAKLTLRLWGPHEISLSLSPLSPLPPSLPQLSFFGASTFLSFSSILPGFPPVSTSAALLGKPCLNAQTKREIKEAAVRAR